MARWRFWRMSRERAWKRARLTQKGEKNKARGSPTRRSRMPDGANGEPVASLTTFSPPDGPLFALSLRFFFVLCLCVFVWAEEGGKGTEGRETNGSRERERGRDSEAAAYPPFVQEHRNETVIHTSALSVMTASSLWWFSNAVFFRHFTHHFVTTF